MSLLRAASSQQGQCEMLLLLANDVFEILLLLVNGEFEIMLLLPRRRFLPARQMVSLR